jgi:hypothetical protein
MKYVKATVHSYMHNLSLKYFRYVLYKYLNISTDFQMKRGFNGMMN